MERKNFIADFMVGRLCKWLRILGYDVKYFKETNRSEIIYESLKERRIILTRDRNLSKKKAWDIILIKNDLLEEQILQLVKERGLEIEEERLFTRCTICNIEVKKIKKEEVKGKVPAYIYEVHDDFALCPRCKKIYWPGTHLDNVIATLNKIKDAKANCS